MALWISLEHRVFLFFFVGNIEEQKNCIRCVSRAIQTSRITLLGKKSPWSLIKSIRVKGTGLLFVEVIILPPVTDLQTRAPHRFSASASLLGGNQEALGVPIMRIIGALILSQEVHFQEPPAPPPIVEEGQKNRGKGLSCFLVYRTLAYEVFTRPAFSSNLYGSLVC